MPDLIDFTKFPSMPSGLSTEEPGEAWIWGDFFAVLQVRPRTVAAALQHLTKQPKHTLPPMTYPFAMSVFYQLPKNPHGASQRPVLVATLERMDYSAVAAQFGGDKSALKELGLDEGGPATKGLFTANGRTNFGDFAGLLTADTARGYFFDLIRDRLNLEGDPVCIGTIADVYGHPETGWPAKAKSKTGKWGCLVPLAALGGAIGGVCALLFAALCR